MALAIGAVRDEAAVGALGFAGEPAEVVDGEGDFALALLEGFAVFQGDGAGNFVATTFEKSSPASSSPSSRLRIVCRTWSSVRSWNMPPLTPGMKPDFAEQ